MFIEDVILRDQWEPTLKGANIERHPHFNHKSQPAMACPCCGKFKFEPVFLHMLEMAESLSGINYLIDRGYCCSRHISKMHSKNLYSCPGLVSHSRGIAVDIKVEDDENRAKVLYGLIKSGFDRFGLGKDFIHVDRDISHYGGVVWLCCTDRKCLSNRYGFHDPKTLYNVMESRLLEQTTTSFGKTNLTCSSNGVIKQDCHDQVIQISKRIRKKPQHNSLNSTF